jgi:hypothetical protein
MAPAVPLADPLLPGMVVAEPPDGGVVVEGELGVVLVWALATPAATSSAARVTIVRFMRGPSLSDMDVG